MDRTLDLGWHTAADDRAKAHLDRHEEHRCLDKCRTPLSFVMQRWRGSRERTHAFLLGVQHGAFCVGCCWALMLLMFAVGTGNVGWMLLLGAVMAVEFGRR